MLLFTGSKEIYPEMVQEAKYKGGGKGSYDLQFRCKVMGFFRKMHEKVVKAPARAILQRKKRRTSGGGLLPSG